MVLPLTTHLIASGFRGHLALPPRAGGPDFRPSLGAGLSSGGCRVNGLGKAWFALWAGQALLTAVGGALAPGHLGLFSQGCTWSQGPRDQTSSSSSSFCNAQPTGKEMKGKSGWPHSYRVGNKKWELPLLPGLGVSEWVSDSTISGW